MSTGEDCGGWKCSWMSTERGKLSALVVQATPPLTIATTVWLTSSIFQMRGKGAEMYQSFSQGHTSWHRGGRVGFELRRIWFSSSCTCRYHYHQARWWGPVKSPFQGSNLVCRWEPSWTHPNSMWFKEMPEIQTPKVSNFAVCVENQNQRNLEVPAQYPRIKWTF